MFIRIHSTKNYGNTGTCSGLVEYLEKENEKLLEQGENEFLENRKMFFNQYGNNVSANSVVYNIDRNCAKLGKNEARFYTLTINPSQHELKHIASQVADRSITDPSQLTKAEKALYDDKLRDYTKSVMDIYAGNFNKKETLTGKDLVYNAMIEDERKYSRDDKLVKEGKRKIGEQKEGFQSHVHVIVSRKDATNRKKLSPFANHRKSVNDLNGKKVPMGFDRQEFIKKCEKYFDVKFDYDRAFANSFKYRYAMKNMTAQVARSYGNQLLSGILPGYSQVRNASQLAKGLSNSDALKQFSSIFYQSKAGASISKALQAAYRPEKLALEIAKKLPKAISQASTL